MKALPTFGLLLAVAAPAAAMSLTSSDLTDRGRIAVGQIYPRCGGGNISPELSWSGAPPRAWSAVLTMIDQDASPSKWSHWLVVDLPREARLSRGATPPAPARTMKSDFGDAAYGGPCPPKGTGAHHYAFSIWFMPSAHTRFAEGASATDVERQLGRTALARVSLTATAQR